MEAARTATSPTATSAAEVHDPRPQQSTINNWTTERSSSSQSQEEHADNSSTSQTYTSAEAPVVRQTQEAPRAILAASEKDETVDRAQQPVAGASSTNSIPTASRVDKLPRKLTGKEKFALLRAISKLPRDVSFEHLDFKGTDVRSYEKWRDNIFRHVIQDLKEDREYWDDPERFFGSIRYFTPIYEWVRNQRNQCMKFIASRGANPEEEDQTGTALMAARMAAFAPNSVEDRSDAGTEGVDRRVSVSVNDLTSSSPLGRMIPDVGRSSPTHDGAGPASVAGGTSVAHAGPGGGPAKSKAPLQPLSEDARQGQWVVQVGNDGGQSQSGMMELISNVGQPRQVLNVPATDDAVYAAGVQRISNGRAAPTGAGSASGDGGSSRGRGIKRSLGGDGQIERAGCTRFEERTGSNVKRLVDVFLEEQQVAPPSLRSAVAPLNLCEAAAQNLKVAEFMLRLQTCGNKCVTDEDVYEMAKRGSL